MSWGLLLNSLALAVPVALAAVVVGWFVALFIQKLIHFDGRSTR